MDYFERYKNINMPYGTDLSSHVINASKDSALRTFLSSPTLSDIYVDSIPTQSVVSNYSGDFFERTFLFEPDSDLAKVGNYIEHRGYTYLTMKSNDDDIYPNLYAKLCNEDFKLPLNITKKKVSTGRGGYTYIDQLETKDIPIVVDVKGYSIADNAILPLTEGRVIIYMKYSKEYLEKIKLNYEFELFNDSYKITDIQTDNIINHQGYIVLSAQKVVETNAT